MAVREEEPLQKGKGKITNFKDRSSLQKCSAKAITNYFAKVTEEVGRECRWELVEENSTKEGNLKIPGGYWRLYRKNEQISPLCRKCIEFDETIAYIVCEYSKLAQNQDIV